MIAGHATFDYRFPSSIERSLEDRKRFRAETVAITAEGHDYPPSKDRALTILDIGWRRPIRSPDRMGTHRRASLQTFELAIVTDATVWLW